MNQILYSLSFTRWSDPEFKVLKTVVGPDPVLVVDGLELAERTSEHVFHNRSVFHHLSSVSGNHSIPVAVDRACPVRSSKQTGWPRVACFVPTAVMRRTHPATLQRLHTTVNLAPWSVFSLPARVVQGTPTACKKRTRAARLRAVHLPRVGDWSDPGSRTCSRAAARLSDRAPWRA